MHNQVMSEIGRAIATRSATRWTVPCAVRRTRSPCCSRNAAGPTAIWGAVANRLALGLIALGLPPGNRVADYGKNSDAYVLLWLACNRAGLQIHVSSPRPRAWRRINYLSQMARAASFTKPMKFASSLS